MEIIGEVYKGMKTDTSKKMKRKAKIARKSKKKKSYPPLIKASPKLFELIKSHFTTVIPLNIVKELYNSRMKITITFN